VGRKRGRKGKKDRRGGREREGGREGGKDIWV
jgi:hypothetical protein